MNEYLDYNYCAAYQEYSQPTGVEAESSGTSRVSNFSYFWGLITSRPTLCMHRPTIGQPKAIHGSDREGRPRKTQKDWTSREL